MRYFPAVGALLALCGVATLNGSFISLQRLDAATAARFQEYTEQFENQVYQAFTETGKLWIDNAPLASRKEYDFGKPLLVASGSREIQGGSIRHFTGMIRVPRGTIEQVRRVAQNYSNYPKFFRPDIAQGSGAALPDSTPDDEHYRSRLVVTESMLWINVAYVAQYDSHYFRIDATRWTARSVALSIRELLDAKNLDGGFFPEGEDHGFVWRTNNYWFVRESNGGIDLQIDIMALSRATTPGFNSWGDKRVHDAANKVLIDTKTAINALR